MQKVTTLIGNFGMSFGNQYPCRGSVVRSFLLPGQGALPPPEYLFRFSEACGVFNDTAIGVYAKGLYTDVNTDFFIGYRKLFCRYVITGEGDKPFPAGNSPDGDCLDVALKWLGKEEFEPAEAGNRKIAAGEFPVGLFQREGVVSTVAFESWETGFLAFLFYASEKRFVCLIKPFKNIL